MLGVYVGVCRTWPIRWFIECFTTHFAFNAFAIPFPRTATHSLPFGFLQNHLQQTNKHNFPRYPSDRENKEMEEFGFICSTDVIPWTICIIYRIFKRDIKYEIFTWYHRMSGTQFVFSEMLHLIRGWRTCLTLNEHRNCFYVATVESGGSDLLYLHTK